MTTGIDSSLTPRLEWDSENLPEAWKKFQQHVILMFDGPLTKLEEGQKLAYLLLWVGEQGRDIYNSWDIQAQEKTLQNILEKFTNHISPKGNPVAARFKFHTRVQHSRENFDHFLTDLKLLVKDCGYKDIKDEMVRDRIVFGIQDKHVQRKLLSEGGDLTLEKTIDIVRAFENTNAQLRTITAADTSSTTQVDAVTRPQDNKQKSMTSTRTRCTYCNYTHGRERACPAQGKTCKLCGKINHFAAACRSKKSLHEIHQQSPEEEFYINCIEDKSNGDEIFVHIRLGNTNHIRFKLDTGAQVNVIPLEIYNKYLSSRYPLQDSNVSLCSYSNDVIPVLGKCDIDSSFRKTSKMLSYFIVNQKSTPILGLSACTGLNLIHLAFNVDIAHSSTLIEQYDHLFHGIGLFPGYCDIKIKEDAIPVIHPPRRIPLALRGRLKTELQRLKNIGVITAVDEPTEWVNSIVIVEKPRSGELRVCLDPKDLNKVILRPHYPMPTFTDIVTKLTQAKYFTVLDAKSGYWNIKLTEKASYLTTFNTEFGRYRFLRMPFGIVSAQDEFQKKIDEMLESMDGVTAIVDDILVYGSTIEEHDRHLETLLRRAEDVGIKFNPDKKVVCQTEVKYFGHVLSNEGVKIDPAKVQAIQNLRPPSSRGELETMLGMFNYLAKFTPKIAEKMNILRELLKKENVFAWDDDYQNILDDLKTCISEAPVLAYFNPALDSVLQVDASQSHLGACLMQQGKPISFASKSLSATEKNYAQIEKELYAILFGCRHFHHFIYGNKNIVIESDHRPLESILKKPLSTAPARLQRMLLQLQNYDIKVRYVPGKCIPVADCLSRQVSCEEAENEEDETLKYVVHTTKSSLPISDEKLIELKMETSKDPVLMQLKNLILKGWPDIQKNCAELVKSFWNHRDELTILDEIIFKGTKMVIPESMRPGLLRKLHTAHLGIEKTQQRARDVMFWPGMNKEIHQFLKNCAICLSLQNKQQKQVLQPHPVPQFPWQRVGTDILRWRGNDYIVVVDYWSRYFEIERLRSLTSTTVIGKLKTIFSRHGIPEYIVSDNAGQFTSLEFGNFMQTWGIRHLTSSPRYPQSNGLAERTVQTVKNILEKAFVSGNDPFLAVLEYRNTPIDGKKSPAQLLMSRRLRSVIPNSNDQLTPEVVDFTAATDNRHTAQNRTAKWYNKQAREFSDLKKGEKVWVLFDQQWIPGTVAERYNERSFCVSTEKGRIRRNRRHIRVVNNDIEMPEDIAEDVEISIPGSSEQAPPADQPSTPAEHYRSRYGRNVIPPERYVPS